MSSVEWKEDDYGDYHGYCDSRLVGSAFRTEYSKRKLVGWLPVIFNKDGTADSLSSGTVLTVEKAIALVEEELQ